MRLSKYCKQQGMSLNECRQYKEEIEEEALAIFERLKEFNHVGSGMYYPTIQIIENTQKRPFILDCLKDYGVEFIYNGEFYRY